MAVSRATSSPHVIRARRTAAVSRAGIGASALVLLAGWPQLAAHTNLMRAGFAIIALSAIPQLLHPEHGRVALEESLASVATVFIIGLGDQRVDILTLLWLSAVASGVLARGGRAHWVGRAVLLASLAMPIALTGSIEAPHVALCVCAISLLLTSGRLTRELSTLLGRARHDADHDALTGTLARSAFRDRLSEEAAGGEERSLLLLDIDALGRVNRLHGHAAGDRVLADVGATLRRVAGAGAEVGRLGGDEFGVLSTRGHDVALGQRIVDALAAGAEPVRAFVGIASAPGDGSDSDALLRAGDIALRLAKRRGTPIAAYEGRSLTDRGPEGARGALERLIRGEGLAIAVQPMVDPRTGRVHAYEALARFGGTRGESPLHWFALADELGRRDALELACLRAALGLLPERPRGTRLSVNLSSPVLLDPRATALLSAELDLGGLIIEITEEALAQEAAGLEEVLEPLRARGMHLAVDDMGAGYAGLGQIAAVRPSYLKLDRSLIRDIDRSPERAALVEALAHYAERTGGHLVAEGVETPAELATVRELGADLVQGYIYARPGAPWPAPAPVAGEPGRPVWPEPAARPAPPTGAAQGCVLATTPHEMRGASPDSARRATKWT